MEEIKIIEFEEVIDSDKEVLEAKAGGVIVCCNG